MISLQNKIKYHSSAISEISNQSKEIQKIIKLLVKKITSGGKVFFCGNGGSCSDAQHLAAEMIVRLKPKNNRKPIPALSLATDTSTPLMVTIIMFTPTLIFGPNNVGAVSPSFKSVERIDPETTW